jgi:hypothetical protein
MYPDELCEAVALRSVKALCSILNLDAMQLLSIACAFCEEGKGFVADYNLSRNELIKHRRFALGLSAEELGNKVNYNVIEIQNLEGHPEYIENWRVHDLKALSDALAIPLQVLLGLRCNKCGR